MGPCCYEILRAFQQRDLEAAASVGGLPVYLTWSRSVFTDFEQPKGVSSRGSAVWLALDVRNSREHWVERRDLADRLLSLLILKGAGELEAEQNAAAQARAQANDK